MQALRAQRSVAIELGLAARTGRPAKKLEGWRDSIAAMSGLRRSAAAAMTRAKSIRRPGKDRVSACKSD
jgi:hypothetical protein